MNGLMPSGSGFGASRRVRSFIKLMQSFRVRPGFPPGRNVVALATEESHQATDALVELTPISSDLTTMYWVIDEVSLPNVEIGYFIHPSSTVASHFREYGSIQIDGEEPALVFASDGGGHLFALLAPGGSGCPPPPPGSISSTLLPQAFKSSSKGWLNGSTASCDRRPQSTAEAAEFRSDESDRDE
ncbi:hypothetical protein [Streptomyces sp. NPDC001435]|uniref:hypothetical protein n=1 Tax=unclassified Streptomyces TaxID=2593676 RepID=UPI0036B0C136